MPAERTNTERKRMAALAGLIRQRQHENRVTQRELGKAIHVSPSTVGRYLNAEGAVPDEDRIIAIADALKADRVEFLAAAGRLSGETFEAAVVGQLRTMRAQIDRVEQTSRDSQVAHKDCGELSSAEIAATAGVKPARQRRGTAVGSWGLPPERDRRYRARGEEPELVMLVQMAQKVGLTLTEIGAIYEAIAAGPLETKDRRPTNEPLRRRV